MTLVVFFPFPPRGDNAVELLSWTAFTVVSFVALSLSFMAPTSQPFCVILTVLPTPFLSKAPFPCPSLCFLYSYSSSIESPWRKFHDQADFLCCRFVHFFSSAICLPTSTHDHPQEGYAYIHLHLAVLETFLRPLSFSVFLLCSGSICANRGGVVQYLVSIFLL